MLFKDRLEVWNPGWLPKGMTVEKLNGKHASLPVNSLLANPVYLAGYIEQVGTGTNDVIDRCLEQGLRKPEFRQDEDFMVTLWRREGVASGNGDVNGDVNSLRGALKEIYLIVLGNPGIKIGQVAEIRKKSESTVWKQLNELKRMNLIEYRDSDKTGEYYVKK